LNREVSLQDFRCQGQRRAEGAARFHCQRGRGAGAGRQPAKHLWGTRGSGKAPKPASISSRCAMFVAGCSRSKSEGICMAWRRQGAGIVQCLSREARNNSRRRFVFFLRSCILKFISNARAGECSPGPNRPKVSHRRINGAGARIVGHRSFSVE
jgi:hypothetical protein